MVCMWSDVLWSQTIFIFCLKKQKKDSDIWSMTFWRIEEWQQVWIEIQYWKTKKQNSDGGGGGKSPLLYIIPSNISVMILIAQSDVLYTRKRIQTLFFFVFLLSQLCIWYVHLRRAYMETLGLLLLYSVDVTSGWRERGLLSKEKSTRWGLSFFFSGSLVCVFQEVKCKHARISLEKYKKLIWTQEQQSSSSTDR